MEVSEQFRTQVIEALELRKIPALLKNCTKRQLIMCAASAPVLQLCAEGACAILSAATPAVGCLPGTVYRLLSLLLFMRMFGL